MAVGGPVAGETHGNAHKYNPLSDNRIERGEKCLFFPGGYAILGTASDALEVLFIWERLKE